MSDDPTGTEDTDVSVSTRKPSGIAIRPRGTRSASGPTRKPSGSWKKKGYHHGNLREALVEEALSLIEEEGVERLTLRAVARRVGVTHAAPYRHFADKTAMIGGVAEKGFRLLTDHLTRTLDAAPSPVARLQALGRGYVTFALEHPAYFRLMFGPEAADKSRDPRLDEAAKAAFALVPKTIAAAQEDGFVRPGDPLELAIGLWAVGHGVAVLLVDGAIPEGAETDPMTLTDRVMANTYLGLKPDA